MIIGAIDSVVIWCFWLGGRKSIRL